jgi:hypothetical protein
MSKTSTILYSELIDSLPLMGTVNVAVESLA